MVLFLCVACGGSVDIGVVIIGCDDDTGRGRDVGAGVGVGVRGCGVGDVDYG